MTTPHNPATQALSALMNLARGARPIDDAWMFGLAWLAAAKLIATGQLLGADTLDSLLNPETWHRNSDGILPMEAVDLVWRSEDRTSDGKYMSRQALAIVSGLINTPGTSGGDVVDARWAASDRGRMSMSGGMTLAPELCELLVQAVSAGSGDKLWIPFDATGQLVVRAARAGAFVLACGPVQHPIPHTSLLLLLEDDPALRSLVTFGQGPLSAESSALQPTHILCVSPFGMRLSRDAEWRRWEPIDRSTVSSWPRDPIEGLAPELDRSDPWTIAAFWPRVRDLGVFVVSPNVLFARGQEQRLREHLICGAHHLLAVASLPTRQVDLTSIPLAMMVLDRRSEWRTVRMIDASAQTVDSKSSFRYSRVLNNRQVFEMIFGRAPDPENVADVPLDEIEAGDFNLMPTRYLRRVTNLAGPRVPLGELVAVVRSPVASKELVAIPAWELGIPQLDRWRPICGPFDKQIVINPRKAEDAMLRAGDILVSIKGTLGKTGLIGALPEPTIPARRVATSADASEASATLPAVASPSCIALRVKTQQVTAEFLFVYLRSADFRRQLEGLRVGASVAHVSPATLLQTIQVPALTLEEQAQYVKKLQNLYGFVAGIDALEQHIASTVAGFWPDEEQPRVG